jgi:hypothetical protein
MGRRSSAVSRIRSIVRREPDEDPGADEWAQRVLEARAKVQQLAERQRQMPAAFHGSVALADTPSSAVDVEIDLDAGRIEVRSERCLIGSWSLDEVAVSGLDDGFHLKVEGEELRLVTDNDARFALGIGLQSASPIMRRRIAAGLDEADSRLAR